MSFSIFTFKTYNLYDLEICNIHLLFNNGNDAEHSRKGMKNYLDIYKSLVYNSLHRLFLNVIKNLLIFYDIIIFFVFYISCCQQELAQEKEGTINSSFDENGNVMTGP
jgi:hypothetical protein